MRIIDQNKEFSIEFDRARISVNGRAICAEIDGVMAQMGAYDSKERAKEVFLDIHKAFDITSLNSFIYNMPAS